LVFEIPKDWEYVEVDEFVCFVVGESTKVFVVLELEVCFD
jgi:hypothetical protein